MRINKNVSVIINLAAIILEKSQLQQWELTRENYEKLASYNEIIAKNATEQQKKSYCYLLYYAYENAPESNYSKLIDHLMFHFRRLCQPLLNNLDSFIPAIPPQSDNEIRCYAALAA